MNDHSVGFRNIYNNYKPNFTSTQSATLSAKLSAVRSQYNKNFFLEKEEQNKKAKKNLIFKKLINFEKVSILFMNLSINKNDKLSCRIFSDDKCKK